MESLLVLITFLTPVIVGLAQMVKKYVPEKYTAVVPVVIGVVLSLLAFPLPWVTLGLAEVLWSGLLAGMAAGGLYSVQNVRNK